MARTASRPLTARWHAAWFGIARDWRVSGTFRSQQAAVVRARIRVLAPVIAVLVLAWIPVDAYGLDHAEFVRILPLRLLLAAGLLLLARGRAQLSPDMATMALAWLQALAFGAMQLCLEPAQGNALRLGYGLFPFVVGAQLAILPLPWGCILGAASATLAVSLAPVAFGVRAIDAALWNELRLLGLIIALAASASHAQLRLLIDLLGARRDASHDPLTGLANRRSAERRLDADRSRALRIPEPLSVVMIDLDHFKQVNDRLGHASGDQVLVAIAQVLRDALRGADLAVRYGGEEFLAILPGTDSGRAMDVADRIRAQIERTAIALPGGAIGVTASLGVATLAGEESPNALIHRADAALYRAKTGGRNRCELASRDVADPAIPVNDSERHAAS